jgi:hypothetical protein
MPPTGVRNWDRRVENEKGSVAAPLRRVDQV